MGLIIEKLGDNYVNANSSDKREGEKGKEKTAFRVGQHEKKEKKR